ncbi:Beta-1,3-glucosyltransferase [Takifugu flavidus]|uniref:Beta-1,3-glucosyltransferase n=1 Tax=Takifugu flavidus TaxID=433684 RepID=A0A5C6MEV8_9TELE|nr:Beta-1,3-glucosyltransferase [Takifugu flavidus]
MDGVPLQLLVRSVVRATWEKDAGFLEFYSDVSDSSIPTISLGVPNTERECFMKGGISGGHIDQEQDRK